MVRVPIAFAVFGLAVAGLSSAQIPVPGSAGTSASQAALPNKKCDSAHRRVAKEERSLASADETIARDKEARAACGSKTACARFDQAIKAMEMRKSRHETRLAKFKADVDKVCDG
jgi:hypothetical protein